MSLIVAWLFILCVGIFSLVGANGIHLGYEHKQIITAITDNGCSKPTAMDLTQAPVTRPYDYLNQGDL